MSEWQLADQAPYAVKVLAWWIPRDHPNRYAETCVIAERCDVVLPVEDIGHGAYEQGCWWANGRYYPAGYITHFIPLPAPPHSL